MENAVSHGLEPQKERGMIKVCLYEENTSEESAKEEKINHTEQIKRRHIIVEDNGVGMDYKKLNEALYAVLPANIIKNYNTATPQERDLKRADVVKDVLCKRK